MSPTMAMIFAAELFKSGRMQYLNFSQENALFLNLDYNSSYERGRQS